MILIVFALCVVASARLVYDYPWCPSGNDELFWAQIITSRLDGIIYPISGAAFVWLTQALVDNFGWSAGDVISVVGLVSVPLLIALVFAVYRFWLGALAGSGLLVLASTAYFWTPVFESKPQQWGQVLVLLGAWLFCLWSRRRVRWSWLLLCASALVLVHILSFALLAAICGWMWLANTALGRSKLSDAPWVALAFVPGVAFMAWPAGPYGVGMQVVWEYHIQNAAGVFSVVAGGLVALVSLAVLLQRRPALTALHDIAAIPLRRVVGPVWVLAIAGAIVAGLLFQASMLPESYWGLYAHSTVRFALAQSGNILFLLLALQGVSKCWSKLQHGTLPESIKDMLLICVGLGVLALVALGMTVWMLDDNWMLRVANYITLFAAPVAAYGAVTVGGEFSLRLKIALAVAATASALLAIRWSGFIACA